MANVNNSPPMAVVLPVYNRVRGGESSVSSFGLEVQGDTNGGTITSTLTSTTVAIITSCAPTVTNCPVGSKTTEVITITTEICPVPEWHKKKIVCYGDHCACDFPCTGDECERHRVVCQGDKCRAEVSPSNEDYHKLVQCDSKGNDCKYSQCQGDECNKKVVCYNGKCTPEKCYGDECNKKVVCQNGDCQHTQCLGEDCHTEVECTSDKCQTKPPCYDQCAMPLSPKPISPSSNTSPKPTGSGPSGPKPTVPPAATQNPPAQNTSPTLVGSSSQIMPALSVTLLGVVAGLAFLL